MEREPIGVLSLIVMVVLLLTRMPVAFVMLVLGMAGIGWIKGPAAAMGLRPRLCTGHLPAILWWLFPFSPGWATSATTPASASTCTTPHTNWWAGSRAAWPWLPP